VVEVVTALVVEVVAAWVVEVVLVVVDVVVVVAPPPPAVKLTASFSRGKPSTKAVSVVPAGASPAVPVSSSATSMPAAVSTTMLSRLGSPSASGAVIASPGPATSTTVAPAGGAGALWGRAAGSRRTVVGVTGSG